MSRSKYYNFAIKMLCDIHIERNHNVNYRNPPWLRDRVFVIFCCRVLHSDYRTLLNNDWIPWGVTICVFIHQAYSLLRILCCLRWVSDTGILLSLFYKLYDLDSMGLYWKGLIGFLLPHSTFFTVG